MKKISLVQLFLFWISIIGCGDNGNSGVTLSGFFSQDEEDNETLLTFMVSDTQGNPVEGAYVVTYRQLEPLHIRVGEGYTDQSGEIQIEDATHTAKGYATVVAPGYNSRKITLDIEPNQENNIAITLSNQDVIKIMSYNILYGFNNDTELRRKFAGWVATYDPDIILFQEAVDFTDTSFETFAKTYGHDYAVLSKTTGFPTGITSKTEITDIRKVKQTGVLHHGYVTGETSGIRVFSIHLCPFEVDDDRNTYGIARIDEIQIIMDDAVQYASTPVMVGGDFNDYNSFDSDSFGEGYQYADKDYTVYNTVKEFGFHDTYPLCNSSFKATWSVENISVNASNEGARLDYIFVNDNMYNSVVFSDIIQSSYTDEFSDHYPTYIEIKK